MWDRKQAKDWIAETCGQGWLLLVDEVYDRLPKGLGIKQCYQKWGCLRFDLDREHPEFESFLEEIAERSSKTCEICGQPGGQAIVQGWETALCDTHFEAAEGEKFRGR